MWATFMYLCRHVNVIRRPVNVCHGFVPSCFRYFCHSNVFHAHACHAIMCHAIVTSCKCLSCKRGHVNERPTSASSCVPSWLPPQLMVREAPFVKAHCLSEHCHTKVTTLAGVLFLCIKSIKRPSKKANHPTASPPSRNGQGPKRQSAFKRCFLNICIFLEQHSKMRTCKWM